MVHRLATEHVKTIAAAIGSVVMPHGSRRELARVVADVLEETTPKDKAGNVKPETWFSGRKRAAFVQTAAPELGVEIVVNASMSSQGELLYQGWSLEVTHPKWGVSSYQPEEDSFKGVMELAWSEHFVRDFGSVPVRIEKL
jgi:hypothetical protein